MRWSRISTCHSRTGPERGSGRGRLGAELGDFRWREHAGKRSGHVLRVVADARLEEADSVASTWKPSSAWVRPLPEVMAGPSKPGTWGRPASCPRRARRAR